MDYLTISLVIFVIVMVVMFTTVKIDYVDTDNNLANVPIDLLNTKNPSRVRQGVSLPTTENNSTANLGKSNPSAPKYGLFNLPEKDAYMSPALRAQIDNMRTQFYYDNCQYKLL